MLDLAELSVGSNVKIKISDDESEDIITASMVDTEWGISRKPIAVYLEIEESTDHEKWPLKSKMLLGFDIKEDESYRFLLKCPSRMQPNKVEHCEGKIEFILN